MNIFKDNNDWNEKAIIGFIAFLVMLIFSICDLVTGYFGRDLVINSAIYESLLWIVTGKRGLHHKDV